MSEKRLASSGDSFVDLTQMETVDLLNELSDDNTKLHKKVEEQQATINHLQEEIKMLENSIEYMVDESAKISIRNVKLWEKNAELQRQIDEKSKTKVVKNE